MRCSSSRWPPHICLTLLRTDLTPVKTAWVSHHGVALLGKTHGGGPPPSSLSCWCNFRRGSWGRMITTAGPFFGFSGSGAWATSSFRVEDVVCFPRRRAARHWVLWLRAMFFVRKSRCRPRGRRAVLLRRAGGVALEPEPADDSIFGEQLTARWCRRGVRLLWRFRGDAGPLFMALNTGQNSPGRALRFCELISFFFAFRLIFIVVVLVFYPPRTGGLAVGAWRWRCCWFFCFFLPTLEYAPLHRRSDSSAMRYRWRKYLRSSRALGLARRPTGRDGPSGRAGWCFFWLPVVLGVGPLCEGTGRSEAHSILGGPAAGAFAALGRPRVPQPVFSVALCRKRRLFQIVPHVRGWRGAGLF